MTNTPDIHHIKTYFVFFIVSACIVGSLVYLYIPSGSASTSTNNHLQSSIISSEVVTPFVEPSDKNDSDEITRKRIILTRLLLKYQGQLESLRTRVGTTEDDGTIITQIASLQEKIDNLTRMITELTKKI